MKNQLYHYSQINTYQFVTFRTKSSIDDFIRRMNLSNFSNSQKQFNIDAHLDVSDKGRLLNCDIVQVIINYCKLMEPEFFRLICISVMPNHIHLMFEQKQGMGIIMQKLKGGLAFIINKHLKQKGSLWERDYFDKVIRDEQHFQSTYKYIQHNAIKANLYDAEMRFYGVY